MIFLYTTVITVILISVHLVAAYYFGDKRPNFRDHFVTVALELAGYGLLLMLGSVGYHLQQYLTANHQWFTVGEISAGVGVSILLAVAWKFGLISKVLSIPAGIYDRICHAKECRKLYKPVPQLQALPVHRSIYEIIEENQ